MKCIFKVLLALLTLASCKKEAGEGGNSSIKGRVVREFRTVLTNPATSGGVYPAADVDVFIRYGNNVSPDDRAYTNPNGEFEFLNLRPGDYTVYVYSKDTSVVATPWDDDHMPIQRVTEITEKKQTVSLTEMRIYDQP
jgi:hypothetical protein